jgi:NADPH:quinone reductase-like Zn-dependent oxidoreductase
MFIEHVQRTYTHDKEALMSHGPETSDRRYLLSAALAAGAGGVIAGILGGATATGTRKAPVIQVEDRRRFRDKVILITGATSGIGAAAAKMFAAEGGKVAFCGRRENRSAQVEREIRAAGGEACYI